MFLASGFQDFDTISQNFLKFGDHLLFSVVLSCNLIEEKSLRLLLGFISIDLTL